jgi:hypothetical protein
VPSQTRALYEQLGSQLWNAPVLRSVLLLYPQLLAFTPVAEFKTKLGMIRLNCYFHIKGLSHETVKKI